MKIMGIDPGNANTGFSVVEKKGQTLKALEWGVIRPTSSQSYPLKLRCIFEGLTAVIRNHEVDAAGIENIFFAENAKTALKLGQARGVALLSAAMFSTPVFEYSPLEIKKSVTGYGRASKEQVRDMVKRLLNIKPKTLSFDASDALAAAICHISLCSCRELLPSSEKSA